jgi:hypothetical protein
MSSGGSWLSYGAASRGVCSGRDPGGDPGYDGPSAVLTSSFKVEIFPLTSPSGAGPDLAEGGDGAEGGGDAVGAAPPPGDV